MTPSTAMARRPATASSMAALEPQVPTLANNEVDFPRLMEMAKVLVTTGFLPAPVKTPAQAVAIILTGRELNIPPMHALRSIYIIEGKPTLSAELQLALFHRAGGRSLLEKSTDAICTVILRHPNGTEHTETFSIEDAKRAGLLTKSGWRNYPKLMLRARCISTGLRVVAPDIVAGIYDPEELGADYADGMRLVVSEHDTATGAAEEFGAVVDVGMTADEAAAMVPPFRNLRDKTLGELPDAMLNKIRDALSTNDDLTPLQERTVLAIDVLLADRKQRDEAANATAVEPPSAIAE